MYQKCPDRQHRTRPNRMYCRRGRWTLGDLQWAGWEEFWWPHWDPSRSCSQTRCRCRQSFSGWTIEMVCIPVDPIQTQLFFGLRDHITSAKKIKMKCRQLLSTSCIHNQNLEIQKLMVGVKRWPRICATQENSSVGEFFSLAELTGVSIGDLEFSLVTIGWDEFDNQNIIQWCASVPWPYNMSNMLCGSLEQSKNIHLLFVQSGRYLEYVGVVLLPVLFIGLNVHPDTIHMNHCSSWLPGIIHWNYYI